MFWTLFILILGIIVGWILYLCFKSCSKAFDKTAKKKEELETAAEKKRTDEVTEDDPKSVEKEE